jgi:hypothetical protein
MAPRRRGAAGAIYTYDAGRMVPLMVAVLVAARHARPTRPLAPPRARRGRRPDHLPHPRRADAVLRRDHPQQFLGRAASLAGSSEQGVVATASRRAADVQLPRQRQRLLRQRAAARAAAGRAVRRRAARDPDPLARQRRTLSARRLRAGAAAGRARRAERQPLHHGAAVRHPLRRDRLGGLLDLCARLLPAGPARWAAAGLALATVGIAGGETYREFLGPNRAPHQWLRPEATAGGEYLRGFGERYSRYVIAEDWPEYTLAYLSYNGGGTPLENHYVLGRRLEEIEARINRYGRKGLVFATDLKPAGRAAFERLSRLFADHRSEEIHAARLGGATVGMALIVEPQHTAHSGLYSDTSRVLAIGGDVAATAMRCFPPVGQALGFTVGCR